MKFNILTTLALSASTALGARFTARRREQHDARLANRIGSTPLPPTGSDNVERALGAGNSTRNQAYSSNWAGAALVGSGYKAITATFVVPTPKAPTGGSASVEYAASAWVGIDGNTATNSILQTGLDFYAENGQIGFDCWYEWYPDYAYTFTGITISAGDTVTISVTANTPSSGTAVVKNVTKGKQVSHTFSGMSPPLQQLNAEWIVEDFNNGTGLTPFVNFGTVSFTNSYVATTGGSALTPAGSTLIDIQQKGKTLTSSSLSGTTVKVAYIG